MSSAFKVQWKNWFLWYKHKTSTAVIIFRRGPISDLAHMRGGAIGFVGWRLIPLRRSNHSSFLCIFSFLGQSKYEEHRQRGIRRRLHGVGKWGYKWQVSIHEAICSGDFKKKIIIIIHYCKLDVTLLKPLFIAN